MVSLEKISPYLNQLNIAGQVDGALNIFQKKGRYLPTCNLDINDFEMGKIPLGDIKMYVVGNDDLTEYQLNTELRKNDKKYFGLGGKLKVNDFDPTIEAFASLDGFPLEPFQVLLDDVFTDFQGKLSGGFKIEGPVSDPDFFGNVFLDDFGLGIPYLSVFYELPKHETLTMDGKSIFADNVLVRDNAFGTTATLRGTATHKELINWNLDLKATTNNKRFLVLNAPYDEEALYYGDGFVNGNGKIYGDVNALNISFDGKTSAGTSLKIPITDFSSEGDYSFITFVERSDQKEQGKKKKKEESYEGVDLFFDLLVTPEAEVEVVIDQQSGNTLKGTGEGLLLMEINTNDKFNMYGEFAVVEGVYNYRIGGLVDKRFGVEPGGRIVWDGDPYKALLDLKAIYNVTANPAPLLENPDTRVTRVPTEVIIELKGELEQPQIDFDIDFPGTSSNLKTELDYRLQDPTFRNNNAFSLLSQGTFVNLNSSLNFQTSQAVTGNLIQSASGLLNSVLTGDNENLNFGVSYEQGVLDADSRVGVDFSTKLTDRVLINGRVGVPVGGVSETVVAGDVELQLLLNESGTLSAKVFSREDSEVQQFLTERLGYTQGLGVSYEVDFDNFRELLHKILNKADRKAKKTKEID